MKRAEELEPLAPLFPTDFAWQLLNVGRLDAAMAQVRKALELNPQFAQALAVMGWIVAEKQMYPEALAAHQKAALADRAWKWPLVRASALAGNRDQARLIALDRHAEGPWPDG
jgi:tetratricopeptide (TPR) repeat protein